MKRTTLSFLKNFQIIAFVCTYIMSSILVLVLLFHVLPELDVLYYFFLALGVILAMSVYGAYLFVLFNASHRMPAAFDKIKNRVSLGLIKDEKEFSEALFKFLPEFYNFAFLDVKHAGLKVAWADALFSSEPIAAAFDEEKASAEAMKCSTACLQKLSIDDEKFYAYSIPIWFEGIYLGYYTVFLKHRLGRARKELLHELEEYFIDDLLINFHPDKEKLQLESKD